MKNVYSQKTATGRLAEGPSLADREYGLTFIERPYERSLIIYFQLAQVHTEVQASFAQYLLDLGQ